MPGTRVTMEDVAARAGVSRALVSIVFREAPGSSKATRQRVLAAARELDYQPDTRASRLGRGRTRTLGVSFAVGHAFHGDLLCALYNEAALAGYDLVLSGVTPDRSDAAAVETLLAERCEGLVLLGSRLTPGALRRLAQKVPVVSLLRLVRQRDVAVVRTDDALGMRLAVDHLRSLGHRRIALLDGGSAAGGAQRRLGYRRGLRAAPALDELVLQGGLTEMDGARAAQVFVDLGPGRATAVVAFNDRCAIGFIDLVRQRGVRVPDDVSVVGFDDITQAAYPHVSLTTVHQDAAELGAATVRSLAARLDHHHHDESATIPPRLVVRGTTARLNGRRALPARVSGGSSAEGC